LNTIAVQSGDMIYLTSDGYADQFGGPTGKKLMTKNLKALLARNAAEHTERQREILAMEFSRWKGSVEQVDDVCIMGVRVTPFEG
jgi:serine phosphatase RsbU (regulator of sigma subunit)